MNNEAYYFATTSQQIIPIDIDCAIAELFWDQRTHPAPNMPMAIMSDDVEVVVGIEQSIRYVLHEPCFSDKIQKRFGRVDEMVELG